MFAARFIVGMKLLLNSRVMCLPGPALHLDGDVKQVQHGAFLLPLLKSLPEMSYLGTLPRKPQRPPHVDLSAYMTQELETTTEKSSMSK